MRLVVWNANMAMHRKLATMVEELQPDVAVIAECADRDVLTGKLPAAAPWTSMAWAGSNPDKGLAVLTFGGYSLTELPKSEPALEWVIPVKVTGPTSFTLLGVWASNHRAANAREFPLVNPQPAAALDAYEMTGPTILAGDFNHNVFWDHLYSQDKRHARTLVAAEQAGLVSAYHHARSEAQGEESEKTFFRRGAGAHRRAHYIDYAFIPAEWLPRLAAVTVGSEKDWVLTGRSDHVPVTVDIADI